MKLAFANIREMVETQARRYGDRIAIRYYERDITYRELDERSSRVANGLLKMGVRKGDRVCILMDNSPEFYDAYFGIIKIGAIAGPVNCWWQTGEIQYLLNDSGAVALFCDHAYRGMSTRSSPGLRPETRHRTGRDRRPVPEVRTCKEAAELAPVEIALDDVATIVYTSGTTGNPKGCCSPTGTS